MNTPSNQRRWSSRLMFFAAAIGSAVGISNIWKFTYVAGENGGGAFVLVYVLAIAFVALPALAAEFMIGRRGGASVQMTMDRLAGKDGISRAWRYYGLMAVSGAFLALSFYAVVAGWTIDYFFVAVSSGFDGFNTQQAGASLASMLGSPGRMMISQAVFLGLTVAVVAAGVRRGLEQALKWMTPALFVILLILLAYSVVEGDMRAALQFMFVADFSALNANTVMMAVGQAFFSLGIGLGVLMTVAAYMDRETSILGAAAVVAFADGFVALLAGLAIFPVVFANGLSPAEGPGLIFATLPVAFGQIPGGWLVGPLFFLLMAFAALTSAITILETVVAWAEDYTRFNRRQLACGIGIALWLTGLLTVFSFNAWSDFRLLPFVPALADKTLFGIFDYVVSNLMMPAGGVAVAILAGWSLSAAASREEWGNGSARAYHVWRFLVRYLVPIVIALIFLANMGG
ncbi:MAG: sodium-dependent transporter [Xanthomonadales bacterium]|nr:sodium-dependent transporter [Xanthomonadales bacterium]